MSVNKKISINNFAQLSAILLILVCQNLLLDIASAAEKSFASSAVKSRKSFEAIQEESVELSVRPQTAYVEYGKTQQYLNFDLLAKNLTGEKLRLSVIKVSVFDAANRLLMLKELNGNGVRPSIETIPQRELEAGGSLLIFNPFHSFEKDWKIKELKYRVTFENTDGSKKFEAHAAVNPVVYRGKTNLVFPLRGIVLNWDGHDFLGHHRRWDYQHPVLQKLGYKTNAGRYSYDFCIAKADGSLYSGKFTNNADWFSFGAPVFAAGGGRVVAVINEMPDNRNFSMDELVKNLMIQYGNQVVIDHGSGEYSLFAHLKQGSVKVKVGDRVVQNQQIAQIGASGSANFPHLHYELRTAADANAEGLPSYFINYRQRLGAQTIRIKKGLVETGEIVEHF